MYHIINDYFITETIEDIKPEEKKIEKSLLEIINNEQRIIDLKISKEEFLEKIKKNMIFLKINEKYKILKDTDYENITQINNIELEKEKLFLQITYNDL